MRYITITERSNIESYVDLQGASVSRVGTSECVLLLAGGHKVYPVLPYDEVKRMIDEANQLKSTEQNTGVEEVTVQARPTAAIPQFRPKKGGLK